MTTPSILLVEDDPSLAENIALILKELGYQVTRVVGSAEDALISLLEEKPSLALIDIKIKGERDGIELAKLIKKAYQIPVVFSTAFSENDLIERAKEVAPEGYLVKPTSAQSLKSTIEIAINNHKLYSTPPKKEVKMSQQKHKGEYLLVRDKGHLTKVYTDEILCLKADGVYTIIITEDKNYTIQLLLKKTFEKIKEKHFIRVHKSFVVNAQKITSFNSKECILGDERTPIGRGVYKQIIAFFGEDSKLMKK